MVRAAWGEVTIGGVRIPARDWAIGRRAPAASWRTPGKVELGPIEMKLAPGAWERIAELFQPPHSHDLRVRRPGEGEQLFRVLQESVDGAAADAPWGSVAWIAFSVLEGPRLADGRWTL